MFNLRDNFFPLRLLMSPSVNFERAIINVKTLENKKKCKILNCLDFKIVSKIFRLNLDKLLYMYF